TRRRRSPAPTAAPGNRHGAASREGRCDSPDAGNPATAAPSGAAGSRAGTCAPAGAPGRAGSGPRASTRPGAAAGRRGGAAGPRPRRDPARGPQASDQDEVRQARGGGGVKGSEVHALDDHDLVERLKQAREEAFSLRFRHATGELENSAALGAANRDVARLLT